MTRFYSGESYPKLCKASERTYLIEQVEEEGRKGLILWNENENIKQKSCIKSVKSDFVIKKYTN